MALNNAKIRHYDETVPTNSEVYGNLIESRWFEDLVERVFMIRLSTGCNGSDWIAGLSINLTHNKAIFKMTTSFK